MANGQMAKEEKRGLTTEARSRRGDAEKRLNAKDAEKMWGEEGGGKRRLSAEWWGAGGGLRGERGRRGVVDGGGAARGVRRWCLPR